MKTSPALNILIITTILTTSPIAYATSWPIFLPPDRALLLRQNLVDTAHCPPGQGKLRPEATVNIHDQLCKSYCSDNWAWTGKTDETCHDLANAFNFQRYSIHHHRDNNGTVSYSVVTAFYGEKEAADPSFTFTFRAPEQHWYCYEMNPDTHALICGNDI
ncbi:hypothetical protein [Aquicella lusitana]|uniref:Uncharacterized protein n=1 Tax=Aquicella lusitana TaxID=254246 RepID=A0A370G6D2_9COXI|nr:hypothetical protein [Aquicella lusitana]RDI37593.1 hypothetical protein C8D86_13715 [Aquicella lusitana]VVC73896.1 hypothetical protein AQULUS_16510 [Aquicella lusitana]